MEHSSEAKQGSLASSNCIDKAFKIILAGIQ